MLKSSAYQWITPLPQSPSHKTIIKNMNGDVCQNGTQSRLAYVLQWSKIFCSERHKHCGLCQMTSKTACWCSKTRFLPFHPYHFFFKWLLPEVRCYLPLGAQNHGMAGRDIKDHQTPTPKNMHNTSRNTNNQLPEKDSNGSQRQKDSIWDCHQHGCFRLPENVK